MLCSDPVAPNPAHLTPQPACKHSNHIITSKIKSKSKSLCEIKSVRQAWHRNLTPPTFQIYERILISSRSTLGRPLWWEDGVHCPVRRSVQTTHRNSFPDSSWPQYLFVIRVKQLISFMYTVDVPSQNRDNTHVFCVAESSISKCYSGWYIYLPLGCEWLKAGNISLYKGRLRAETQTIFKIDFRNALRFWCLLLADYQISFAGWVGRVERVSYRVLVRKCGGTRTLGRPSRRWQDNIKKDF